MRVSISKKGYKAVKIEGIPIVTPSSWKGMAKSDFSKVVNLPEESKMTLSVFSGSEDVIKSRRGKDSGYSIFPNTVHSIVY